MPSLADRLMSKLVQVGDCWEFTGSRDNRGYGRIGVTRRHSQLAHRVSYEIHIGEIPHPLELDHLCRNPSCCNPWHMEPVSHQENVRRGRAGYAPADKCKHGHDLSDPSNVYVHTRGQAGRKCKPCALARARERYEHKKTQEGAQGKSW